MTITFVDGLTDYLLSIRAKEHPSIPAVLRWALLSNGLAASDGSVIFFGFEDAASVPTLVVKAPRLPENAWSLQIEYDRLVELWSLLGDAAIYRLPQPVAMANINGTPALITTYLRGENFLRVTRDALWGDPEQILALAIDVAESWRGIMDRTATMLEAGEQVPTDFRRKTEKFRQMYRLDDREKQIVEELLNDVETAAKSARRKILLQGDFWHGNMIRNEEHGKLMFIDWQYSRWSTDVSLDVYLFLLAGSLSSVRAKNPEEKAGKAVQALKQWNEKIIPAYLSAFGKPDGYGLLPLRTGMLMCCVEKAVRESIDFGVDQVSDIIWRHMFAKLSDWQNDDGWPAGIG